MGIEKQHGPGPDPARGPAARLALDLAALTRVLLGVNPGLPVVPAAGPVVPGAPTALPDESDQGGLSASRRSGALLAELSFLDD